MLLTRDEQFETPLLDESDERVTCGDH